LENNILWQKIHDDLKQKLGKELRLLYPRKISKKFSIRNVTNNVITIQFIGGKNSSLYLNKSRFFSAYNFLKENQGKGLSIGDEKNRSEREIDRI